MANRRDIALEIGDPRLCAEVVLTVRLLPGSLSECPPFVAASVIVERVEQLAREKIVSRKMVIIPEGGRATVYFKLRSCKGGYIELREGACLRIFDPVMVSTVSDAEASWLILNTHITDTVGAPQ